MDYASLLHVLTLNRWLKSVLDEEWRSAEVAAGNLLASHDSFWSWLGSMNLALTHLYRGRSEEALDLLERAAGANREPSALRVWASSVASHVLLEKGQANEALAKAQRAARDGNDEPAAGEALFFALVAQARLGDMDEAERAANEIKRKVELLPTERDQRRYHHLAGELALARGDTARAIAELRHAHSMLRTERSEAQSGPTPHLLIWFSLASAHLASGDETSAADWLSRVSKSGAEHIDWPIPYVRSFYFLGKVHGERGEVSESGESYRRFLSYWGEGDLDPEKQFEAKKNIS